MSRSANTWLISQLSRLLQPGMPENRSTPQHTAVLFFRRQKRNKIHGKVAAKTALVLTHVYKWFLVLLRPLSGRTAVKGGRLRWTGQPPPACIPQSASVDDKNAQNPWQSCCTGLYCEEWDVKLYYTIPLPP